jgi:hypothetical protein
LPTEANAGRAEESATRTRLEAERAQVGRRIDGLYEAIADGLRTAGLKTKLEEMEARLAEVDAKLSAPAPSLVRLHPQLSQIYRRKVEKLSETLADPEIRPMALETIRGLIESVTIGARRGGHQSGRSIDMPRGAAASPLRTVVSCA